MTSKNAADARLAALTQERVNALKELQRTKEEMAREILLNMDPEKMKTIVEETRDKQGSVSS